MLENQIYNDNWFFDLTPEGKLLFIYLITNESCNLTGCYQIPLKVISTYTGLSQEKITKLFTTFKDKATYKNGWVIIPNYLKHNPMNNPNIEKAREKQLSLTPKWVLEEIERVTKGLPKGLATLQDNDNGKIKKEGGVGETKFKSLKSLTPTVLQELATEKRISLKDCQTTYTQMKDWLESKGKTYKDYKAGLRNWINKKLEEGRIKHITPEVKREPTPIITEEERAKNIERLAKLRSQYKL